MTLRDHLLRQIAALAASPTPPPVETLEAALADVTAGRLVAAQHRLAALTPGVCGVDPDAPCARCGHPAGAHDYPGSACAALPHDGCPAFLSASPEVDTCPIALTP